MAVQSPRSLRFRIGNEGFAILMTLTLMSFLVVLLMTLAALSKVESRISGNAVQQTRARQNALMAMNIALGQLQKYAGPDTRVTATAEALGGINGTAHYTGVWDSTDRGPAPLAWLVSGNEGAPGTGLPRSGTFPAIELVGAGTSGVAGDVVVPLQPMAAANIPGQDNTVITGHYGWWIGDQGVKASVALADRSAEVTYGPFDSAELRSRLRQQRAQGAGPVDSAGIAIFEPGETANSMVTPRVTDFNQLGFMRSPGGAMTVDHAKVRPYFHAWAPNHAAVLANTKSGGLRQDLSLAPGLLGPAFAAWADYSGYMEDPAVPLTPAISPAYPAARPVESLRRRYRLTAPQTAAGVTHGVAPVLSYFLISFNVRTDPSAGGSTRPLEVRARWMATLWNPYTSAIVPEPLVLEVEHLPSVQVFNDTGGGSLPAIELDSLYGQPLRINLPWTPAGRDDHQSWLPGRVHTWSAREDLNKGSAPPSDGFASVFYTRMLSTAAGQGVQRAVPSLSMANSAIAHLAGNQTQLVLRLYHRLANGDRELLGTYVSPMFAAFSTTPAAINLASFQFTYVFHLTEGADTPALPDTWLTTAGQDPREPILPAGNFSPGANGPRPELYPNYTTISFPDRLLDRALPASTSSLTGQSYNEDTPLFELPRSPLLSVGGLQHLAIAGSRPFTIGNSWGDSDGWNGLFDRYFFSGLSGEVNPAGLPAGTVLPNPLLGVSARKPNGEVPTAADLTAKATAGYSSGYLLQSGAFNLNSVNPAAWQAVLRSGRFTAGDLFHYLDASPSTGSRTDTPAAQKALPDAVFFRFPMSAQETYKADAGYAASTSVPPAAANVISAAGTHLFRRGVRALSPEVTAALAKSIAGLVRQRLATSGPCRTTEEFLAPNPLFGGRSLLEQAIADTAAPDGSRINGPPTVPEFSSQWLTQGDLMTMLAPILFPRSDSFVIRTYGDMANPVTGEPEGRAWAEACVQRMPDYVDAAQPPETAPAALNPTNRTYGRRFKLISFRWLAASDI